LKSFSTLDSKGGFDEVSAKIRRAMKERGKQRSRWRSEEMEAEDGSDGEGISMGVNQGKEDRKDV
jgi:glycerol-3-phosphate O-acyltransferase/dihydroxyacetone phosphate acyltransferase